MSKKVCTGCNGKRGAYDWDSIGGYFSSHFEPCDWCGGSGVEPKHPPEECPRCGHFEAYRDHDSLTCHRCQMTWPLSYIPDIEPLH